MPIFGRFNESARKVIAASQLAAVKLRHAHIGTEHFLIGLLTEARNEVSELPPNIIAETVIEAVKQVSPPGDEQLTQLELTPRVKLLMENAVRESRSRGVPYITSAHLWYSLLSNPESVAVRLLISMGCDIDKVRKSLEPALSLGQNGTPDTNASASNAKPLEQYGRDLTAAAERGELDPVIGRTREIERIVQILSRRTKNNPILIGEPGVGKSAVAEGLAQCIVSGNIPDNLSDKRLWALDMGSLVAGTKFRGEFEERIRAILKQVKDDGNIILFIDEMQNIVGAGSTEGGTMDAANLLKPALARRELQCVGATTLDEYRKHIEKDTALARRFQPVNVDEPGREETLLIMKGLRDRYEAHHKVRITDEALEAAVRLSDRYIADRFQPDKAIDLMDEAASRVRIRSFTAPPDIKAQQLALNDVIAEKSEAIGKQDFERAAELLSREKELSTQINELKTTWETQQSSANSVVTADDIAQVVALWTGIPVERMTEGEAKRLQNLEELLHKRVIGQDEAVSAVARAVRRARAGLQDPKRPIGSFIFLGPTGVGKTELCRALGEALFGDEDAVVRLDMSEYMEKHSVSRMIGSPPGYVGFEEGGKLTEAVRRKPYSVLLFDEIEKAHPDIFNILLQVLEDGRLTDNVGRTVSFRNCIIVLTSNAGAQAAQKGGMGFGAGLSADMNYERMREQVMSEMKKTFRPEFINRVDEIIVFKKLSEDDIGRIAGLMTAQVAKRVGEMGVQLTFGRDVVDYLAKEGFDEQYGARPLRRVIQRRIEDALSERLISGEVRLGDTVHMGIQEDRIVFTPQKTEE